jgi:hypothetical protein
VTLIIIFFYGFALQRLEGNDASAENLIAVRTKISWRFEAPDEVARGPILTRVDVPLDVDVYFRPERSQRSLGGEKVVHELIIVDTNEITCGLDVHVLRPHQNGHEVVAFQTAVKFHVIGIKVLELDNK